MHGLKKKRTRYENGGSGAMVSSPVFDYSRVIVDVYVRPSESVTPLDVQFQSHANAYVNTTGILAESDMFTDDDSCALDAFNAAVAYKMLTRERIQQPSGPVMLVDDRASSSQPTSLCKRVYERDGFQLQRMGSKQSPPSLRKVLQQKQGVFIVEFYWRRSKDSCDWHVIAVNCHQRKVFCNTLGVLPFGMGKTRETAKTHEALVSHFFIRNMVRVWRILYDPKMCKLGSGGAAKKRKLS